MFVGDVCVYLGGADIAVAKHRLDRAYIGTVHQEVGSVAVSHSVRADVLGDAG